MRQATSELDRFQQQNKETFQSFTKVGQALTATGLAIGGALGLTVKSAASFDTSMRKAGAIAGATAEEFDLMKAAAIKLGADTSKSAGEVSEAKHTWPVA
nr:phage tail tape measure protein [Sporosarcina sp. ACRSL]